MKRIIVVTTLALGLTLGSTTVYAGCSHCGSNYSETSNTAKPDQNAGINPLARTGVRTSVPYRVLDLEAIPGSCQDSPR